MYNCHANILKGYQRITQSTTDRTVALGFEIYPQKLEKDNEYLFDINIDNRGIADHLFHDYSGKSTDQVILKDEHGLTTHIHIDKIVNTYSPKQLKIGDFHIIGIGHET